MKELFEELLYQGLIEDSSDGDISFEDIQNGKSDQGWFINPEARQLIEEYLKGEDKMPITVKAANGKTFSRIKLLRERLEKLVNDGDPDHRIVFVTLNEYSVNRNIQARIHEDLHQYLIVTTPAYLSSRVAGRKLYDIIVDNEVMVQMISDNIKSWEENK